VPTLKADDALRVIGQPIDDFALTLVAPLSANYYDVFCHFGDQSR
jgi:hypothetical protein